MKIASIPIAATQFVESCVDALGLSVIAIVLEGSFARGDQTQFSDIDMFVLVDHVDNAVLHKVGTIVTSIETEHELNPALVSLLELRTNPVLFEYLRFKHDGIVLYGRFPSISPIGETELDIAKRIAQTVLMSSRHYLAVNEPAESFQKGKLKQWNLKPLSFALRFFHYHKTGHYIRSKADLTVLFPILALHPIHDYQQILDECISLCETIIGSN